MLTAIVAVSSEWGIGNNGELLFNIPDDKRFFKNTTLNHTIIMGRKTLQSLPNGNPLPNRHNIVLSRSSEIDCEGIELYNSIDDLMSAISTDEEAFVIGGGEVYSQLLPYCNKALITKIEAAPPADVYFPNLDKCENWVITGQSEYSMFNGLIYSFCTYQTINERKNDI